VDAANISVFLSDDTTPSSVHINVQLPTQLYTFLASRSQGSAPFTISPFQSLHATASLPILATRHRVHDTLVLNHAGSLELVTSGGRSLGINLPKIPVTGDGRDEVAHRLTGLRMVLEEDDRMGAAERRIMGLSDAVGSRYTVIFEDGEKLRISADFRIQHLLVRQCFEALSYVLTPEAFFSFKRELISHLEGLSSLERGDDVAPWTVFRRVLFAMIGIPLPVSQSDAYEHLLDASQQSADPVTRRLAVRAQAKRRQASPQPTPRQALGAMIDPTEIPGILLTLHLVAQDCRLSSSRQKDLPALATVLVELSGRLGRADWRDYWLRLVPSLQGKEGVPHSESLRLSPR
jgi:anaphase-promoting complex subunit 1